MKTEKESIEILNTLLGKSKALQQLIAEEMGKVASQASIRPINQADWDKLFSIQKEISDLIDKIISQLESLVSKK